MRALVQRVVEASVLVEGQEVGRIGPGLVVFLGFSGDDEDSDSLYLVEKTVNLRIFADSENRFNRSALDVGAELLLVSQFTLYADTRKGRRPDFNRAAGPLLGPGCELRIVDFDRVGPENLATQPVFTREDVGRPKAIAMAEKLAPLCDPELRIRPLVMRYEERPPALSPPSLRIACPDSFAARQYANRCSLVDSVPLVEAGSAPLVAQQRSYLPGRTACLEHRIPNLADRAARERDRASCSQNRAFTLPGTSMVSGGILAAEALRALQPENFGWPSAGTVVYDARFPERFGIIDFRPPCFHSQRSS